MNYDENSVFKSSMTLLKLLINNEISVIDYLKQKKCLSEDDLTSLNVFGRYTLEAIIIHVLGSLFNSVKDLPLVKVATLIDLFDSTVRVQAGIKTANSPFKVFNLSKVSSRKPIPLRNGTITMVDYFPKECLPKRKRLEIPNSPWGKAQSQL